jgi:mannitol-1-phosphate 5-dehydrogenase
MNRIRNRSGSEIHTIVIFGAGKIGRSFIGQLFSRGGYKVVFVDVNMDLVARLNKERRYKVITKGGRDRRFIVKNVEAISFADTNKVADAVAGAGIMAVSVGKNALENVIPVIAAGLERRYRRDPGNMLDIIIAENMINAGDFMRRQLMRYLPSGYPLNQLVGLVETSIGKMVPLMTSAELEKDPLMIYAEPYNTLILDRKAFRMPVPGIKGLEPKDNIKAWIDRKACIHNLGHATAAYYGFYRHPNRIYMYEVLNDRAVLRFTREVMLQAADVLQVAYPGDFSMAELENHVDDLLSRFRNKALRDTVFRVGHDLTRKLDCSDRFMVAIHLARKVKKPYDMIAKAMSYGFSFRAEDEEGNMFPSDLRFLQALSENVESTLIEKLHLDPEKDFSILEELKKLYYLHGEETVK